MLRQNVRDDKAAEVEKEGTTARLTVLISQELKEAVKDAVWALSGPPNCLTVRGFVEAAFRAELSRLEKRFNQGKSFPKRRGGLRVGRPMR